MTNGEGSADAAPENGLPELVYVPIGSADPAATETVVELRVVPDGTTVVPAYSDQDRLVAGCGPGQPWMLIPIEMLADLREVLGFDQIALDVELPPDERKAGDGA